MSVSAECGVSSVQIRAEGAETIMFMVHAGGSQTSGTPNSNTCEGPDGPIFPMVAKLPPEVKVVLAGHVHSNFNCRVGEKIVIESQSNGHLLSRIDLTFVGKTLAEATATNEAVKIDDAPDPAVAAIVDKYTAISASKGDTLIGTITEAIPDNSMGSVVADGMLYAGAKYGADVALMNTGGIRAGLEFTKSGPETVDGQVRYAELFTVQPFSNTLVVLTLSGDKLLAVLDAAAEKSRLAVAGLTYSQSPTAAAGGRVLAADVLVNGKALDVTKNYHVVVNSIVQDPTTGYAEMASATEVVGLGVDLDALVRYVKEKQPISLPEPRIFPK